MSAIYDVAHKALRADDERERNNEQAKYDAEFIIEYSDAKEAESSAWVRRVVADGLGVAPAEVEIVDVVIEPDSAKDLTIHIKGKIYKPSPEGLDVTTMSDTHEQILGDDGVIRQGKPLSDRKSS